MPAPIQLRAQGIDALKSQRFDDAADLLNSYLDAAPADREAELALAAARSGQGKHVAALTIFERHLEREPQSPSLHFNRGTTLERLGRKAEATKAYEQVLKLKSDHAKAQARLAALHGTPRPPVATVEDIPEAIAADRGAEPVDGAGESKVRRRTKKGRWIHPGMLIGLLVYAVAVLVLACVVMPPYQAGGYAGAVLFSLLLFLGGLQAVYRARHGLSRLPAAVGHVLVIVGAMGLVYDGGMDVFCLVTGRAPPARNAATGRQPAARNAQAAPVQASRPRGESAARKDFGKNPGLIDTAIKAIRGGNENQIGAACLALRDNYRDARKGEVIPLLEGLLSDPRPSVRTGAAKALGAWGNDESIAKLEALAKDEFVPVRFAAANAIETIKKRKS